LGVLLLAKPAHGVRSLDESAGVQDEPFMALHLLQTRTETQGAANAMLDYAGSNVTEDSFAPEAVLSSGDLAGRLSQLLVETKASGGLFMVFTFPLTFNSHALYNRRFGVDLPANLSRCGSSGCPILVDFPGSGGSIFSQRGWTQWYAYQDEIPEPHEPYILVTMEGSPDAIAPAGDILPCTREESPQKCADKSMAGDGYTSWNVLGWGVPTDVKTDPQSPLLSSCFPEALKPWNAYQCFETHLLKDVDACRSVPREQQEKWSSYAQVPANCASASGANDWDYVRKVLEEVTAGEICAPGNWCGDRSRIYLTGQSMGGMSALQWATPDPSSRYFLKDLQPAAIAACSPGGSRNNDLDLQGQVPTLLMQGSSDTTAVPVAWVGYTRDLRRITNTPHWKRIASNDTLVQAALQSLPAEFQNMPPGDTLLLADVRQGGALLAEYLPELVESQMSGFPDRMGRITGISAGAYMWEPLETTLQRIVGKDLPMKGLHYWTPQPQQLAESTSLQCADATPTARVCIFRGGHTYPFLKPNGFEHDLEKVKAFHQLIWVEWFRNGTLQRPPETTM